MIRFEVCCKKIRKFICRTLIKNNRSGVETCYKEEFFKSSNIHLESRESDGYKGKGLLNGQYVLQHKNHAKVRAKISLFATAVSDWTRIT